MTLPPPRWILGRAVDASVWRPAHLDLIAHQLIHRRRNAHAGMSDRDHLVAAARWLARAQDAMTDGGIGGRYNLRGGWSSSYAETTGYIIPTLLALADELNDATFHERAEPCVEFLLRLQLPDGGFPGGEVLENTAQPSIFNTAQIITGLRAWHVATGDARALDAACRAADWLVAVQDADGAWRRHTYNGTITTYTAHASCWLAELGQYVEKQAYLRSAERHLDWVLGHRDHETGWFDLAGFNATHHAARRAVTHTIAYTLWGVLLTSEITQRADGIAAVQQAASGIARRLQLSGWLAGVLDRNWRAQANYACLTGNAQMALVWLRLHALSGDARYVNAALKAIDLVKRAQALFAHDPNVRGGIAGSDPVWGRYLYMAYPNWAAKFFIDALLAKREAIAGLSGRPLGRRTLPADIPTSVPLASAPSVPPALRVVLYASPQSAKVEQMVRAWSEWGFRPAAVVIERRAEPSVMQRLGARVRDDGPAALAARVFRRRALAASAGAAAPARSSHDPIAFCASHGIPVTEVTSLDSAEGVAAVRALRPDLAIHAGAGILRAAVLAIPRLGTLNAHMGLLPYYRGMNVAEWARFRRDEVGCTVHLIDGGIDTGDILCASTVSSDGARSIRELRDRVDTAQIRLLGQVVRFVCETGALPPRRPQRRDEGRQFFRMHPELAAVLDRELKASAAGHAD